MKLLLTFTFCFFITSGFCQIDSTILKCVKDNYKISYPSAWTLDTSKIMGTEFFIFSPKENEADKFRENINLLVQDLKGIDIDLDKYAQISTDQIKTMANEGIIFESKKINTGDGDFYKVIFGMTQGVLKLKVEQYYFIKENKAYVVTFSTESDKFDKFKTQGEFILNSFVLIK